MKDFEFYRLEGCGNLFNVLCKRGNEFLQYSKNFSKFSQAIQDRGFGLGGDGLMVVTPPKDKDHDFFVVMRNPDGSPMGMCGNGIRCVVRTLFISGLVESGRTDFKFDVEGRTIFCQAYEDGRKVKVNMGQVSFDPRKVPHVLEAEAVAAPIEIGEVEFNFTGVSIGNPHAVIFVDDVNSVHLERVGPQLENHKFFPQRANIEFVEKIDSGHYRVRVWERGVGVTLACGTGACAVLMAVRKNIENIPSAIIELPGGSLTVNYEAELNEVYLVGPAREIAKQILCDEFIDRCANE